MGVQNVFLSGKGVCLRPRRYPTTKIRSRTPLSARACTTYSRRGRFPTGIMTFGTDAVKGPIRAPSPAARMTAFMRGAPADDSGGRPIPHATGISLPGPVVRLRIPWVRGEEGPRTDSTYPIVRCSLYYKYIYNFRITITKALIE